MLWVEILWILQLLWTGVLFVSKCRIILFSLLFVERNKVSAVECVNHMLKYSSAMIAITVGKTMHFLVVVIFFHNCSLGSES